MQNDRIQNTETTDIVQATNTQQQSNAANTTDELSQNLLQSESDVDSDTEISSEACNCETGCATEQCSCVKAGIQCGRWCNCRLYECHNQVETANSLRQSNAVKITDESSRSLPENQSVTDVDTKKSSHVCSCKTGCSTRRCGCVKAGIQCGKHCKCKHYACGNQVETANSLRQSNAAKITHESSRSLPENQSVTDVDTKKSSHVCSCKTGCSTRRCGCVKAGIQCGQRCKCRLYECHNQIDKTNSQLQSSANQTTDELSQTLLQSESDVDSDTEISSEACNCETGCATEQCSCVKCGIQCGRWCKCKLYGCDNQIDTTNSQLQSSAKQTTDELSQSLLQSESVVDSDTEISSHACSCKTGCSTRRCGCVKAGIQCGKHCKCKHYACDNQVETANSLRQSNAAKITDESSRSLPENQSVTDVDTKKSSHVCRCKAGCSTRRCGCVKAGIQCGQRCKCRLYECHNQIDTTNSQLQNSAKQTTDELSQNLLQSESDVDSDTEISSHACSCKTGCSTRRCGCVNGGIQCGQSCKCRSYGCQNQGGKSSSQQMSGAAQVTNVSTAEHLQQIPPNVQSVPHLDTEISSHACSCKTGCSTRRCGCVNGGIQCGQSCKCRSYGCQNQGGKSNSQQMSGAAQVTNVSTAEHLQQIPPNVQSVPHLDTEISSHACSCKTGCSTRRCGCVNGGIQCGQSCKCRSYGCQNQGGKSNSQQMSGAAQVTNVSTAEHLQQIPPNVQSVPHLDTEISSHACSCKTGCSTRRCGCVNGGIQCGQSCKCRSYGCQNQGGKSSSQQMSGAAQVTNVSTAEHLQQIPPNVQSVPHLDTEISSHACSCKTGCSTRRCGCVNGGIQCGQSCKCRSYGCQNQGGKSSSQQMSGAAQVTNVSTAEHLQQIPPNVQSVPHLDTEISSHACSCKTGCSTRRCGCVNGGIQCGQSCKCRSYGCQNQGGKSSSQQMSGAAQVTNVSTAEHLQQIPPNVQSVPHLDTEISSHACSCKTGCSTRRCGCVNGGIQCGQSCKCRSYGCQNQGGKSSSQQMSGAAQVTNVSTAEHLQQIPPNVQSVPHLDTEISSHACSCKTGCSTRRCGCVNGGIQCGQSCKCRSYGCQNQGGKSSSQQMSGAAQVTNVSTAEHLQQIPPNVQSVPHLDTEISSHACSCKTGCSTRRCGCVNGGIQCGQSCKCRSYGCQNQGGKSNSQQMSGAAQVTNVSTAEHLQQIPPNVQSVPHLDTEISSHACSCKTGCSTRRCGCVNGGIQCGQSCKCRSYGCQNQGGKSSSQQMSGAAQVTNVSTAEHLQQIPPNVQSVPHLDTEISSHACSCKTGCSTRRCGCVNGGIQCGQSCKCRSYGCQNQGGKSSSQQMSGAAQVTNVSTAEHLQQIPPNVQSVPHLDTEISSHACSCKTGCSTRRCGCVNGGIQCGQSCKCRSYGCQNQGGKSSSQQMSGAAQVTNVSTAEHLQQIPPNVQSVPHLDTEISSHACSCKTGCSTRRCGCVNGGIQCGQSCKCRSYGCQNQGGKSSSQQMSGAAQVTNVSTAEHLQQIPPNVQSVPHLDTEISSHACSCKTGCSTRRCGCVNGGIQCGQSCKCRSYGCQNQGGKSNSQQMSGAAQVTNVSTAEHLQQIPPNVQSVPHLDTEISSHACSCKTGCSTRRCGCVNGGIQCGQSCKCRSYGCQNQGGKSSSQQMSGAAQVTNVSSAGHLQRITPIVQSVPHLNTAISSHACICTTGCSTQRCGCVKGGIQCGQSCKCRSYGCQNQRGRSSSQQMSVAAQVRNVSTAGHLLRFTPIVQNVRYFHTAISSHACTCRTGCSTRRCGCVNRGIRCGGQCACAYYGCSN